MVMELAWPSWWAMTLTDRHFFATGGAFAGAWPPCRLGELRHWVLTTGEGAGGVGCSTFGALAPALG